MAGPSDGAARRPLPAPLGRYAAGVAITVVAILSQYFVPQNVPALQVVYYSLPGDLFVVYGIPILAFAVLVGAGPLRNWPANMDTATWQGLRWFGGLGLLALFIIFVLTIVYELIDPSALALLSKPNPALTQAQGNPWFWVGFSFVIGAFEETIFRGWIFGYWRDRSGGWIVPALWTSVVFAGVHVYYGLTYEAAYPLIFPSLFLTGVAFAATYRASGGNLVIVALIHGASDATAFLTIISLGLGVALHYLIIGVGAIILLIQYFGKQELPPNLVYPQPWPAPPRSPGPPAPPAGAVQG